MRKMTNVFFYNMIVLYICHEGIVYSMYDTLGYHIIARYRKSEKKRGSCENQSLGDRKR